MVDNEEIFLEELTLALFPSSALLYNAKTQPLFYAAQKLLGIGAGNKARLQIG